MEPGACLPRPFAERLEDTLSVSPAKPRKIKALYQIAAFGGEISAPTPGHRAIPAGAMDTSLGNRRTLDGRVLPRTRFAAGNHRGKSGFAQHPNGTPGARAALYRVDRTVARNGIPAYVACILPAARVSAGRVQVLQIHRGGSPCPSPCPISLIPTTRSPPTCLARRSNTITISITSRM